MYSRSPAFRPLLVLLWAGYTIISVAQGVNFGIPPMRNFSKKTYQAGTQNWDAAQDSRGVMYWANNDGLLRFDGTTWTTIPVANQTIVRSVAIDHQDRIYAGAQSELGYFSPGGNGALVFTTLVNLLLPDHQAFEDVWDIVIYDGDVFFRTNKLVFQYTNGSLKAHAFSGQLYSMFTSPEGLIVQQDLTDLRIFDGEAFTSFLNYGELKSEITGAIPWTADTLLVTTLKHGIFYLSDGKPGKWVTSYDELLMVKRIYSSTLLQNGHLALGTSLDGLIVLDQQRRVFRHLNKKKGLQNNNILSTFSDRAGNVWLGLDNGIDCVVLDSPFSSIYPDGEMQATGYAAAVFQDQLYLGVSNGAYAAPWQTYYDPELEPIFKPLKDSDGQVWSLALIGDQLMMGHHEGAFQIDHVKAESLLDDPGAWTFVQLSDAYMLGGTYTGLVLYKRERDGWVYYKKIENFHESCRIMVSDADGTVWISHPYRGLYHVTWPTGQIEEMRIRYFDQPNGLPSQLNNYVFQIAGKAVFATENGVYHYDRSTDRFVSDSDFNTLLGNDHRVKYLREDEKGNIWYVTDQEVGLLIVDDFGLKKEVQKKTFPELADKLVGGFEFIYPIDEHNVLIGAEQGFLHYSVHPGQHRDTVLQIIISQIRATGTGDSVLYAGNTSMPGEAILVLESGMNNLSFAFSATDFKNPALIQYRAMLQGLEKEWPSWSSDTRRHYTNLGPGLYTFRAQARHKDGFQSDIVTFTFRIRPPWYKSPAALVFYGLGFSGLFVGFVFRQRQKFESEKERMTHSHRQKEAQHIREVEMSKAALTEIQNEKLEAEIKYKNQELALTTMHLVQKAEILLTVQEALNQIQEQSSTPALRNEVRQLLNLINFDVKLDEDWEHFAYHFDQVHVDFLKHLREHFPQLSSNDYKLCAYLRMNLSTKEIAPLMNISVRGVEGSRYRLRKKLNLPNDANLTEFILNLPPSVG